MTWFAALVLGFTTGVLVLAIAIIVVAATPITWWVSL